jgi:hypothetical protein
MIENESSAPYLLTAGMTIGLGLLLYGVEVGTNDGAMAEPLQAVGGSVIVLGILGLAYYLERLPESESH